MALAVVTVAGEDDADGEALTGAVGLELLTGSPAQPAATIERAMTSPKVIYLLVFILFSTSLLMFIDMVSVFRCRWRAPLTYLGSWSWCWATVMGRVIDSMPGWGYLSGRFRSRYWATTALEPLWWGHSNCQERGHNPLQR